MKKLKLVRRQSAGDNFTVNGPLYRCPVVVVTLEDGERPRRGCGQLGMMASAGGWKCFYCGNYIFGSSEDLQELWFHFRLGREYWRVKSFLGMDFINGVPVSGKGDSLPRSLWPDLGETAAPGWFAKFIVLDEDEFDKYMAGV